ncbi:hypothetical protein RBSH_02811 [Rhodopirellula baltica SH28]|uniref:Uncharacterized protein n=1 Tax=Rhodopirellula baltica SH28 TaxID=993517 RepID=K5DHE8_RHOBT|nr:hypothetical protein RBSH_02811 [Rhodopirellula baltica SH28]
MFAIDESARQRSQQVADLQEQLGPASNQTTSAMTALGLLTGREGPNDCRVATVER